MFKLGVLLFAPAIAFAQNPGTPKFEVASVKPAGPEHEPPYVVREGPGTADPERITYERTNLLRLLTMAYRPFGGYDPVHMLDWDQIIGPAWISTQIYSIDARLPPGTTKEQLPLVWRDFLAERFHLKTHVEQREFTVYELTVVKGGPKFRPSGDPSWKLPPGFPVPRAGETRALSVMLPRDTCQTFVNNSMNDLIQQLAWPLSDWSSSSYVGYLAMGKVIDKTGLTGKYDFALEYAGRHGPGDTHLAPLPDGEADTAPPLFEAVRQQLGLQLRETKMKLDVLVVDSVDRNPTDN